MSGNKAVRCTNFMYEQQLKHLPTLTVDNLIDTVEKNFNFAKYALIVHDKDVDENGNLVEEHVHLMVSLKNSHSVNSIAKNLGDKTQYVQAWRGDSNNGYAYLIHATSEAQSKYQYSPKDVRASAGFDYESEMKNISNEVKGKRKKTDMDVLLDTLYNGIITKKDIEETLTGSQYGKARKQIEDVWAKHLQRSAEQWRKEMISQNKCVKVVWISGCAGVGKTSLAKEYAKKTGQDYFVSGSSRDIFQNYAGEHIMILDEFRPHVIEYHDLLKITDPFGMENEVMAPSRYNDKALACEFIIITSPYSPFEFYNETFKYQNPAKVVDSFEQLNRRISLYINMDTDYIYGMSFDKSTKKYEVIKGTKKKNPYSFKKRPSPSVNAVKLYDDMIN